MRLPPFLRAAAAVVVHCFRCSEKTIQSYSKLNLKGPLHLIPRKTVNVSKTQSDESHDDRSNNGPTALLWLLAAEQQLSKQQEATLLHWFACLFFCFAKRAWFFWGNPAVNTGINLTFVQMTETNLKSSALVTSCI